MTSRYFTLIVLAFGLVFVLTLLLIVADRQSNKISALQKKVNVLECSIVWNDNAAKISFSNYVEYQGCLLRGNK